VRTVCGVKKSDGLKPGAILEEHSVPGGRPFLLIAPLENVRAKADIRIPQDALPAKRTEESRARGMMELHPNLGREGGHHSSSG